MLKQEVRTVLASNSVLREGINLGNPVLAQPVHGGGGAKGVSVELSDRLAVELGVPVQLICFDHASRSFDAIVNGEVDIAFLAIDPQRAEKVTFSDPYVQIEGTYLVRHATSVVSVAEIDRPSSRIASSKGSAYDLHLSRTLKHAELIDTWHRGGTGTAEIWGCASDCGNTAGSERKGCRRRWAPHARRFVSRNPSGDMRSQIQRSGNLFRQRLHSPHDFVRRGSRSVRG
ncbi:transporter substrate-binding domain-containing protein [Rhizobium rhizogenes]|uniref:transporter substrate-binding domain-containing protein n=1 Tax=Rhizobium rhizogenes TaxID=359 RepID=UPI0015725F5B|nr:transporter substrate-binding domain-containing protein [Rhizobium rhizogenes]